MSNESEKDDSKDFFKTVGGILKGKGVVLGAGLGFSAASTVYGGLAAAGLLAAVPAAGTIFVSMPIIGAVAGWKLAKIVVDKITED